MGRFAKEFDHADTLLGIREKRSAAAIVEAAAQRFPSINILGSARYRFLARSYRGTVLQTLAQRRLGLDTEHEGTIETLVSSSSPTHPSPLTARRSRPAHPHSLLRGSASLSRCLPSTTSAAQLHDTRAT